MAEGLARKMFGTSATIESAGSEPKKVNPLAIKAMREVGIDISQNYSKSYADLKPEFLGQLKYLVTLCAEEVCPQVTSRAKKIHWPLPDPASQSGNDEERLARFRETREALTEKLKGFAAEIGAKIE